MAQLICLLLSIIFALLSALAIPHPPRFDYLPAAVGFLALSLLLGQVPALR